MDQVPQKKEEFVTIWHDGDWWPIRQTTIDEAQEFGVSIFDAQALRNAKRNQPPKDKMRRFLRVRKEDFSWKSNNEYGTVFHLMACYRKNKHVEDMPLEWLDEYRKMGVDPKAVDRQGRTALHVMARNSNNHCVNYIQDFTTKLIEFGVPTEAKDNAGYTFLDYFAQRGCRPDVLRRMLDSSLAEKVILLQSQKEVSKLK